MNWALCLLGGDFRSPTRELGPSSPSDLKFLNSLRSPFRHDSTRPKGAAEATRTAADKRTSQPGSHPPRARSIVTRERERESLHEGVCNNQGYLVWIQNHGILHIRTPKSEPPSLFIETSMSSQPRCERRRPAWRLQMRATRIRKLARRGQASLQ